MVGGLIEAPAVKLQYEIALEFFFWGLETFSRRDCGLILAGYRRTSNEAYLNQLLDRWRQRHLIERHGRGKNARFSITATGRNQIRQLGPTESWARPWDGKWRVFSFDLPSPQRRQRMLLWRALRDHKLGLLQRSVWIWPHEVEPILKQIIEAQGIPECFCGFECSRLFLCNDSELVATAWDFEEINRRHQTYLQHTVARPDSLERARDLRTLAHIAWVERDAFAYAFSLDPLLPRALWPRSYRGEEVAARRQAFRACLARRLRELSRTSL